MEREKDVLLPLEVVVERSLRESQLLRDLAQRGLVVAVLVEQIEGDVQDPFAGGAAWSPGPDRSRRPRRRVEPCSSGGSRRGSLMTPVYLTAG